MDIKSQLKQYNIIPNKALGQNFLADEAAVNTIIASAEIEGKNVLEIGAGMGALTHRLNALAKKLLVVEIDKAMVDVLSSMAWSNPENIKIIHSDFLKVSDETLYDELGDDFCVVANLPYYITTPVCMKLLQSGLPIESMTLMMQKEAAVRFTAPANSKLYSPLAVLIEYLYNTEEIMELTPASYYPQPDVNSTVLSLSSKKSDLSCVKPLSRILKAAFATRRKTIQNNLLSLGLTKTEAAELLNSVNIPCSARAEQLSVNDFLHITQAL